MLLGRVVDAGLRGGFSTVVVVRPLPSYTPFAAVPLPLTGAGIGSMALGVGAGAFSSMGESGGGGMFVPSVSEKVMGLRSRSSNRPVGLLVASIVCAG
jgi:hypothetical protein